MADTQQHRPQQPSEHHAGPGHGNSVAAWTAVGVIMIGFLVMCVAVAVTVPWVFVVGAVIVLVGAITGKVLGAMGFGAPGRSVR